jgi:hypothetical protein
VDLRLLMAYGVFLLFLGTRARRLKRRVAEIVDVAACRAGLLPIRKGKIAHAVR